MAAASSAPAQAAAGRQRGRVTRTRATAAEAATAVFGAGMGLVSVVVSSVVVYAGVGLVMSPSQTAGLKELVHEEHPHGVSIINTIIGALIMGIMRNGMNVCGINTYWQQVVLGILLVLVVAFEAYRNRKFT